MGADALPQHRCRHQRTGISLASAAAAAATGCQADAAATALLLRGARASTGCGAGVPPAWRCGRRALLCRPLHSTIAALVMYSDVSYAD